MTEEMGIQIPASPESLVAPPVSPEPQVQEKLLRQSEVNDIVHRRTSEVADKARREGYEKARAELSSQQANAIPVDEVRKIVADEVPRIAETYRQQSEYQNSINSWVNKIQEASKDDPEFTAKVSSLGIDKMPEIAVATAHLPNTADVMRHLADYPHKIPEILNAMRLTPHLVNAMVNSISQSLSQNKTAKTEADALKVSPPLSQISPSSSLAADDGKQTVSDFRKMFRG